MASNYMGKTTYIWKHKFRYVYTVSPRFYGLIQTGPCPESEKVLTLKIEYNTVLYCTVNSLLYCFAHILIGYNIVQYAYIVYIHESIIWLYLQ